MKSGDQLQVEADQVGKRVADYLEKLTRRRVLFKAGRAGAHFNIDIQIDDSIKREFRMALTFEQVNAALIEQESMDVLFDLAKDKVVKMKLIPI